MTNVENIKSKASNASRNKDFAKRLDTALSNFSDVPSGRGRQKWLRDRIEERCNVEVSPEAVRRWFAALSYPRPQVMDVIARALETDVAWLALGVVPDTALGRRRQTNARVSGAVNLIAGMIQMSQGTIAFPTKSDEGVDLYAIIDGEQHQVLVRPIDGETKVYVPVNRLDSNIAVILVHQKSPVEFPLCLLNRDFVTRWGTMNGAYYELKVSHNGTTLVANEIPLPRLQSFSNFN